MRPKHADPFDVENLQLPPEMLLEPTAAQKEPKPSLKQQPAEGYVQMTEAGAKGFQALGCPGALVWFEILYRVWKSKKTTIGLPNGSLADRGVSRFAKYRAIRRLERAGLVHVERVPRKTVRVTLLDPKCVVFQRSRVRDPH